MAVDTFATSLAVAILTIILTCVQTRLYVKKYTRLAQGIDAPPVPIPASTRSVQQVADDAGNVGEATVDGCAEGQDPAVKGQLYFSQHPVVMDVLFRQGLDIAANFPAAVLTLVAYGQLPEVQNWPTSVYIITAIVICFLLAAVGHPNFAGRYCRAWKWCVSLGSLLLLLANGIGLYLAVVAQ